MPFSPVIFRMTSPYDVPGGEVCITILTNSSRCPNANSYMSVTSAATRRRLANSLGSEMAPPPRTPRAAFIAEWRPFPPALPRARKTTPPRLCVRGIEPRAPMLFRLPALSATLSELDGGRNPPAPFAPARDRRRDEFDSIELWPSSSSSSSSSSDSSSSISDSNSIARLNRHSDTATKPGSSFVPVRVERDDSRSPPLQYSAAEL
mmetsp:Transcript_18880/g.54687  ORF Transcript_18880/g.54687 Transcript_18880/m.54687 type:complete len:206 (+) Transcript_18880:2172-2789(+)